MEVGCALLLVVDALDSLVNEIFFDSYKKLREQKTNANNLFEIPALFSLLPELKDKTVLDLGCGFGEHCKRMVELGAKHVVGIDLSEKMLEVASHENSAPNIRYLRMPMENITELNESFDLVVSSLALHYVEDFEGVVKAVHRLLIPGGIFVFSQEHPLTTCHFSGNRWTKDEQGNTVYLNLSNYGVEGEKDTAWFVDHVKKYHRTFSTILNTLIDAGFCIEKTLEPLPTEEMLEQYPHYKNLLHKPDFLLIRARK